MYRFLMTCVLVLAASAFSLGAAGCQEKDQCVKTDSDHPRGEHPTAEHPKGEHPKGEHPKGEHPKGEHPK